ncbi:Gpi-anchor transamidase-like protein [Madurella fahalii]|uniref:Gpi-anchor transamidase-like protein n=1 Tax=Madurella fahalii TaxID=1157608 RepID=A0ABQ0GN77_9PEZI
MATSKPNRHKFLPLREITLNSRPLVKRAIQFSCDGDLAVTADDSVHIFVPEFPDLSRRRENRTRQLYEEHDGTVAAARWPDNGEESSSDGEEYDNSTVPQRYNHQTFRAQYSEGSKHMPVSYPPLDPRVNKELYTAAGIPFPYEGAIDADNDANTEGGSGDGSDESTDSDAYDEEDGDGEAGGLGFNRPYGAGYGPITGVGSSMNHVVSVGWSPSGLGVNRRPILAVLTGSGTLTMYGDSSAFTNILPRANEGMLQRRELNSWIVLWGVGERLVVPGQQTEISECIRGFSWAHEMGPGQALLATINDVKEVGIISVQSVSVQGENKSKGDLSFRIEPRETVVWLVREIARFKAEGPHTTQDQMDPDFVPCGTSFGLRWGPWLETDGSRTCVLSFTDRNYVGFKRVTVKDPWIRGELPNLEVESNDIDGRCLHLSSDAFVEFEDGIWTHGPVKSCRGLIVTGFHVKTFELVLSGDANHNHEKHTVWDCGTAYDDGDHVSQNPIVDLVIHPPDFLRPTPIPLYTLIRMSATPTTKDWFETNVPPPSDPTVDARPQWVRSIAQKLEVLVPVDMHLKRNYTGESDSDGGSGSGSDNDDEGDLDADDLGMDSDDDENIDAGLGYNQIVEIPEIHPYRYRLHGLTLSPGGGVAAVLASSHSTQHPERGGWHTVRSSVLFGHKPRRRRHRQLQRQGQNPSIDHGNDQLIDPQVMDTPVVTPDINSHLTTEAKLFEYLYGGGPEVPGIHYYPATSTAPQHDNTNNNNTTSSSSSSSNNNTAKLRRMFAPALENQICDLCGARMNIRKGSLSGCEKGHFFGTCATSGLAVQTPGGTRSCGACGLRTMRAEVLVAKMAESGGDEVRKLVGEGVCGACGGKFLS